jgi:hypothetical protein
MLSAGSGGGTIFGGKILGGKYLADGIAKSSQRQVCG